MKLTALQCGCVAWVNAEPLAHSTSELLSMVRPVNCGSARSVTGMVKAGQCVSTSRVSTLCSSCCSTKVSSSAAPLMFRR
jgi:hypothetical protein